MRPTSSLPLGTRNFQGSLSPRPVWFRLLNFVDGTAYRGTTASAVSMPSDADVADFRVAVQAAHSNKLSPIEAADLLVFSDMVSFEKRNAGVDPLEEDSLLDGLGKSEGEALAVVVPNKLSTGRIGGVGGEARGVRMRPAINFRSENTLLKFLESHMSDSGKFHCIPHVIDERGRSFKLSGRDSVLSKAADCFKRMLVAGGGKEHRRIPICFGISGIGKSRMLEEWKAIFDIAGIRDDRLGVLVSYDAEHQPHSIEKRLTIEASFSWRLLHRLFIEGNGVSLGQWFSECLPSNAGDLYLEKAIDVIRLRLISRGELSKEKTLHLFIGIDEYQNINSVEGIPHIEQSSLQDLLLYLGSIMASPARGVRVLPMMAGNVLSVLYSGNLSYRPEFMLMPMPFLSTVEVENAIASVPHGQTLLGYQPVRRHLVYFGGVSLWAFRYAEKLIECLEESKEGILSSETIDHVFANIQTLYPNRWEKTVLNQHSFSPLDFVFLAAYSLSGVIVQSMSVFREKLSWRRLEDSSVCFFSENYPGYVHVPYPLYYSIAKYDADSFGNDAIRCFLLTLRSLFSKVDTMMYDRAPWQLWEVFGAHFHALRINALLILGQTAIPLSKVFAGALMNMTVYEEMVRLKPMLVMETEDVFSADITAEVGTKGHYDEKRNWIRDGWVVINGESGKAVDLFFSLERSERSGHVVVTDQRKRISGGFGVEQVSTLVENTKIIPTKLGSISSLACVFTFSNIGNFVANTLPSEICVVSSSQTKNYHGSLWIHPAASPCFNVNSAPVSTLRMLFEGKDNDELCREIINSRSDKQFREISEFQQFVKKQKLEARIREDAEENITFS